MKIPFGQPQIDDRERAAVAEVLIGTQLVHGPRAKAFEQAFAARSGSAHAISVSSCTAGLHLSLFTQGVGPGDKVIVPAMTHVATAHAVEYCGAQPVFADVQADSGNIDPDQAGNALAPDVRAMMVVHYLGLPCEMDRLQTLASDAGIFMIEDCALAVDATFDGVKVGNFGLTGCYSFYPVKHMTTLEGGMVTTNDDEAAALIANRKAFGYDQMLGERKVPGVYDVAALGYNFRMNEVQAAIGAVQLEKLDGFLDARRRNFRLLFDGLREVDELTVFNDTRGAAVSSCYCLNIVLPRDGSIERTGVIRSLNDAGVGTSVHYPSAVPLFSYYREKYGYRSGQFPVAEWLGEQAISLPVGPHVREDDISHIIESVKTAIAASRQ